MAKNTGDDWMFGYECYLTGGFNDSIISNPENKTFLPAAKTNPNRFVSSASGLPLANGKLSVGNGALNELGFSYMGGVYNTWMTDATIVDDQRSAHVFDADCNVTLPWTKTNLIAEWAWIHVDVPPTYTQQYGSAQQGGFMDIVQPVYSHSMLGWDNATFSLALDVGQERADKLGVDVRQLKWVGASSVARPHLRSRRNVSR